MEEKTEPNSTLVSIFLTKLCIKCWGVQQSNEVCIILHLHFLSLLSVFWPRTYKNPGSDCSRKTGDGLSPAHPASDNGQISGAKHSAAGFCPVSVAVALGASPFLSVCTKGGRLKTMRLKVEEG